MMMILGMFVFKRRTLPFQSMTQESAYRWGAGSRVGARPTQQFLGIGDENITLVGELHPEITGGNAALSALKEMASGGRAWPLLSGEGQPYGMFVIESVNGVHSDFLASGTARTINFTLKLKRVDESLVAMFGDLKQQAVQTAGKVMQQAGQLMGDLP